MDNKLLLNEGGAGMHMMHPFDLPSIRDGRDLLQFFYKTANFVARNTEEIMPSDSTSLKVDGANTAFKLVRNSEGKLEFAFDRGSMFPIDISGITVDRLVDPDGKKTSGRWPAEHGMVEMGRIQLSALNQCLRNSPEIIDILIRLGLLNEDGKTPISTKYVNTEFCWKETNAVKYEEDFIAFHGINQFYEKEFRGVRRPGLIRPLEKDKKSGKMKPIKATAAPVPYDEKAMEDFRKAVSPYFKNSEGPKNPNGFNVYTIIPVRMKPGIDLVSKIDEKLESELTIQIRSSKQDDLNEWSINESTGAVTRSIKEWLSDSRCVNPRDHMIKASDGSSKGAMSKQIYGRILSGEAVEDILMDPSGIDTPMAINGALFYYSIENVGATILEALTSPLGDLITSDQAHEGIVLRNREIFGVDSVKITGNFITAGSAGKFAQSPTERVSNEEQGDPVEPNKGPHIALIPGAFKPPHRGHLKMVERFTNIETIDKVLVIISRPLSRARTLPTGEPINEHHALAIWEEYLKVADIDIDKVKLLIASTPSPVKPVYDFTRQPFHPDDGLTAPPHATVYLGCGDKENDSSRYDNVLDNKREDLQIKVVTCPLDTKHSSEYMSMMSQLPPEIAEEIPSSQISGLDESDFHAKDMRFFISVAGENETAYNMLEDFVPAGVNPGKLLSIIGVESKIPNKEPDSNLNDTPVDKNMTQKDDILEIVYNSIHEVILESTPFQAKMKKRLSKAHAWFLDQGRHDLTKHGKPFSTPRPKNKSNAFLAEKIGVFDRAGQIWEPEDFPEGELEQIEELSAAGGAGATGAVEGFSEPLGSSSPPCDSKTKSKTKTKKKKKRNKLKIRKK